MKCMYIIEASIIFCLRVFLKFRLATLEKNQCNKLKHLTLPTLAAVNSGRSDLESSWPMNWERSVGMSPRATSSLAAEPPSTGAASKLVPLTVITWSLKKEWKKSNQPFQFSNAVTKTFVNTEKYIFYKLSELNSFIFFFRCHPTCSASTRSSEDPHCIYMQRHYC